MKLHTTHTTAVITTASALLSEFLFLSEGAVLGGDVAKLGVGTTVCVSVIKVQALSRQLHSKKKMILCPVNPYKYT